MSPNKYLSIVIPTYNRADFLDHCLNTHVPIAKEHDIEIFISDNASTDNTTEIVNKWMIKYQHINYFKNQSNLGPDNNFELALKYPKSEYIWLLGDTYEITREGINYILEQITNNPNKYDLFLLNIGEEIQNVKSKDYTDRNILLLEMCWLMTCMSCLIYNVNIIKNANFIRYRNTHFIQTGIIFEYIADKTFNIHWKQGISVKRWQTNTNLKKESWQSQIFKIWFEDRANFIFSLPAAYKLDIKLKCIMSNGPHDGMSIKKLLYFRSKNVFDYKTYKQYSYIFPFTIHLPKSIILLISIFPKDILSALKFLFNAYKSK